MKPESLCQIEKTMWKLLIDLVVGKVELETTVDALLAEFSESFIQNIDVADSGWFLSLGMFIVAFFKRH